jgi:hypothetical protein
MMTNEEDRAFVEQLKHGDKVFVWTHRGCGGNDSLSLKEVKRITKPHIIVEIRGNEQKFRKDNLEEAGHKFGRAHMGSPHYEIVEYKLFYIAKYERQQKEIKCKKIIRILNEKNFSELPDEVLNEYYEVLLHFDKTVQPLGSPSEANPPDNIEKKG